MRRKYLLFGLAAAIAALALLPGVRDEVDWRLACLRNTPRAYRSYERANEKGRHSSDAIRLGLLFTLGAAPKPRMPDRLFWWWTRAEGSAEAYIEYLEMWPEGRYRAEATGRLDRLRWTEAIRENSVVSYQRYLDDVEEGPHRAEAEQRQRELQQDDRPFQAAAKEGTGEAWRTFLQNFRGHRRSGEALGRLADAEPNSIFRLAREGELTISAEADLLYRFAVILHKHRTEALPLSVPRGLYLKAKGPRVMDMVATHGFETVLDQDGEILFPTPAASAGMRKRPPAFEDQFSVLPTPPNNNLARLVAFFAFKMPEFRLRQGAIWIVTDDARWGDLKRYMHGQTGADPDTLDGDKEIGYGAEEAINALMILEAAGLDIRRYAIWQKDRAALFWNLLALDSPEWHYLENVDRDGVGRCWADLKAEMAERISPMESRFVPVLKAKPTEVSIRARPISQEVAWLAWYLREQGHEVDIGTDTELPPTGATVWGTGGLWKESRAIADLIGSAFGLTGRTEQEPWISFRGRPLDIDISPMGTNDEDKRRRALDQTPRWLRWIP